MYYNHRILSDVGLAVQIENPALIFFSNDMGYTACLFKFKASRDYDAWEYQEFKMDIANDFNDIDGDLEENCMKLSHGISQYS